MYNLFAYSNSISFLWYHSQNSKRQHKSDQKLKKITPFRLLFKAKLIKGKVSAKMKNISSQDYRNCYCRKDPGKWRWGADQEYQKMKKCTVNQGKNTYFQWFSTPKTWQYVKKFRNRHCGSGQKSGNIFFQMCNILISSGIIGSTFIDYFEDWFRLTALKLFSANLYRWFTGEH